jgi:hypothetical protein
MRLEGPAQQANARCFAIVQVIKEAAACFIQAKISADFHVPATDRRLGQIQGACRRRHRAAQLD